VPQILDTVPADHLMFEIAIIEHALVQRSQCIANTHRYIALWARERQSKIEANIVTWHFS
jgi:hypothetical protein